MCFMYVMLYYININMFKISIWGCKNLSVSLCSNDLIPAGQCFTLLEVPTEPKDLCPLNISKYYAG